MGTVNNTVLNGNDTKIGCNLKVLEQNDQIKELQTIIRDRYGDKKNVVSMEIGYEDVFVTGIQQGVTSSSMRTD